jgi:hypothetical protein
MQPCNPQGRAKWNSNLVDPSPPSTSFPSPYARRYPLDLVLPAPGAINPRACGSCSDSSPILAYKSSRARPTAWHEPAQATEGRLARQTDCLTGVSEKYFALDGGNSLTTAVEVAEWV